MNTNQILKKMSGLTLRSNQFTFEAVSSLILLYEFSCNERSIRVSVSLTIATDMITKKLECTLISKEFSSQVYHAEIYDLGFRQLSDIFPTVIFVASHF